VNADPHPRAVARLPVAKRDCEPQRSAAVVERDDRTRALLANLASMQKGKFRDPGTRTARSKIRRAVRRAGSLQGNDDLRLRWHVRAHPSRTHPGRNGTFTAAVGALA
jgi:hypothetical protein